MGEEMPGREGRFALDPERRTFLLRNDFIRDDAPMPPVSRRAFIQTAAGLLLLPRRFRVTAPGSDAWQMGVIADLHHGLEPTALSRLESFLEEAERRGPDAILQLGDFNYATPESRVCTDLWNTFRGPRHHVLGNHDMDFVTKEEVIEAWEMPGRYYRFEHGGYAFFVLDRNNMRTESGYVPYANANFYVDASMRAFADPAQLEWLEDELARTTLPVVVFVHQGLGVAEPGSPGEEARQPIESILAAHNRRVEGPGVVACFCGHHHLDRYAFKDDIHYVWLNSASYYWVGDEYGRMAPYADPLYTFLTFHGDGRIEVEGRHTTWAEPSPEERGFPGAAELTPYITGRVLGG